MPRSGVSFSLLAGVISLLLLTVPAARAQDQPSPTPASPSPAPTPDAPAPLLTGSADAAPSPAASPSPATPAAPTPPPSPYRIEIDLGMQRAYLLKDGKAIAESPISSGRAGHLTPTGDFSVVEKDLNHLSSLYGKIVDRTSGRTVISGADAAMAVPKGCKFLPAPMKFFLRFDGAAGMHAGILPGYPASHGCVRMPASKAALFYKTVSTGTPVHVFGTTPARRSHEQSEHVRRVVAQRLNLSPSPAPIVPAKRGWWHF